MFDDDITAFQYLNNADLDSERVTVISNFGTELLDDAVNAHIRELSV